MDRVLSLDLGLLVVRLRDGQRARALRRAAGAWTQPPTRTLPESSRGASGTASLASASRAVEEPPTGSVQGSRASMVTARVRPLSLGRRLDNASPG